jgi:hypothetical protein
MLDGFGSSSERRFDITGGGVTYQLAMGGTLSNGLVIGGLAHTTLAWSPTYELENGAEVEGGSLTQGVVGPFVDYYIDPAAGFHLQFAAGLALVILDGDDPDRRFPNGDIASLNALGIVAGTGYEVFVGREFAMGLLGTFQFAAGNLRGQQASELGDIVSMAFGALLSVTHH